MLLPLPSQVTCPTWLVEVRWQLSGHSSRDVTLLAGSQSSLVGGVSFGSCVRGPTGAQRARQQGRHLVNYTGRAHGLRGRQGLERNANRDRSHRQESSVTRLASAWSLATHTFKACVVIPLQEFGPLKGQIPDFSGDAMPLNLHCISK